MSKPDPVARQLADQIAEYEAVTVGMIAAAETMRGAPLPWASEADLAADVAAMLHAMPKFAAALRRKSRNRGQLDRQEARRVLVMLYGDNIPAPAVLPNKALCRAARRHLKREMSDSTILRAAGRKP